MILKSKDSNRPINPIALLRARLKSIETALLFDGKAYPDALVPMPFELIGRGFFPGGDGLWRGQSALREPSTHPYPFDGIMFVGQDFGSQARYPRPNSPWESGNATWRFLIKRIENSGIPGVSCFFTNALLGLRKVGSTVGQNPCIANGKYMDMCRAFLAYQIEILNPRLIVIFKSVPDAVYLSLLRDRAAVDGNPNISSAFCVNRARLVLQAQHPSSDYGVINRIPPSRYHDRCNDLAQAWAIAKKALEPEIIS